ncbi:MAG: hypothetical protein DWQ40_11985 [Actinobacteria bacterium]|nr:MAG: hypothetical protein DWQ40_11985 [Actinomycetota bacterium]
MIIFSLLVVGCGNDSADISDQPMPDWVEEVDPPPGSVSFVPDHVIVHHNVTGPDEEVRLLIDGVDVTTYATFDAAKLSYEPEFGPIELTPGVHTATVQLTSLPVDGVDYAVVDSWTWEFTVD